MKKIAPSAVLFAMLLCQTAWAQPTPSLPTSKIIALGDEQYALNDTYNALTWYMKAYDRDESNVSVVAKIAQTHERLRDYKEAASWFGKLSQVDKNNEYPLTRFKRATALKCMGSYEDAINEFMAFEKTNYAGPEADYYKKLTTVEIEGARWARKNPDKPEPLVIENMGRGINTSSTEHSPIALTRNEIIYSSLRTDSLIYTQEAAPDKQVAKIFTSKRGTDGKSWEDAKEFNHTVLFKEGFHAANPLFNADRTLFYFLRAQLIGNDLTAGRIMVCTYDKNSGALGEPKALELGPNNSVAKNPTIAVIDGKQFLIFSSNMEGGKGGFDLWIAEMNADGSTRQPLNMGDAVNTFADEITPFFDSREKILYFSTKGFPTVGGLDIFRSKLTNGTYSKAENMGFGFNMSGDDFGFMINQEGEDDCYGYLVSNRAGTISMKSETCGDDIFSVLMPDRCDIIANIEVFDETTGQPLIGAGVQLIDKSTGAVVDEQSNKEGNKYRFKLDRNKEYEVVARKDGFEKPAGTTRVSTLKKDIGDITEAKEISAKTYLKEGGLMVETYNAKTQQPLTGVKVALFDAKPNTKLKEETQNDKNRYAFVVPRDREYKVEASKDGFKPEVRTVVIEQVKGGILQKVYLTPIELPIFYNVYFDFDKHEIRPGAKDTLDMVFNALQQFPNLVVEVRGHTDAKGSDSYNDKLSEKRTAASLDYLTAKGVVKERMIPRALGEKEPAAQNELEGKDNPEGRQLNRRVEFKIIDAKDIQSNTEVPQKTGVNIEKKN